MRVDRIRLSSDPLERFKVGRAVKRLPIHRKNPHAKIMVLIGHMRKEFPRGKWEKFILIARPQQRARGRVDADRAEKDQQVAPVRRPHNAGHASRITSTIYSISSTVSDDADGR